VLDFRDEAVDCVAQRVGEFGGNDLADESVGEWIGDGGGKLEEAAPVEGGEAMAEAGQGEGGVTDSTDHAFGLPEMVSG